jgi:hypothetical protein
MLEPWVTPDLQDSVSGKTSTSTAPKQVSSQKPPMAAKTAGVGFGTSIKTAGPGQITSKEVANLA